jgi:hypothetical protein
MKICFGCNILRRETIVSFSGIINPRNMTQSVIETTPGKYTSTLSGKYEPSRV